MAHIICSDSYDKKKRSASINHKHIIFEKNKEEFPLLSVFSFGVFITTLIIVAKLNLAMYWKTGILIILGIVMLGSIVKDGKKLKTLLHLIKKKENPMTIAKDVEDVERLMLAKNITITASEMLTEKIKLKMEDTYTLFNSLPVPTEDGKVVIIPHILVGPSGLFCMTPYNFRGTFTPTEEYWEWEPNESDLVTFDKRYFIHSPAIKLKEITEALERWLRKERIKLLPESMLIYTDIWCNINEKKEKEKIIFLSGLPEELKRYPEKLNVAHIEELINLFMSLYKNDSNSTEQNKQVEEKHNSQKEEIVNPPFEKNVALHFINR